MIAADSSVLIDYFKGIDNIQTKKLDEVLMQHTLILAPIVLTEIFSDSHLPAQFVNKMLELPILNPLEDYWLRVGKMRAKLINKKLKARLADTLIAQSCIDYKTPLITGDTDFRHFVKYCGLVLF
jgi:predicted nucleic acid-binding protein